DRSGVDQARSRGRGGVAGTARCPGRRAPILWDGQRRSSAARAAGPSGTYCANRRGLGAARRAGTGLLGGRRDPSQERLRFGAAAERNRPSGQLDGSLVLRVAREPELRERTSSTGVVGVLQQQRREPLLGLAGPS